MPDLLAARSQMALSLGWHIVIACFGVGFPLIVLLAEWRVLRTGDAVYSALARGWSKALGVLFAVGAVSGTILSFELGILWPGFMGRFGEVIGLPFAIEGIAFFVEAIFVGLYLYGWDRLSPRVHVLTGVPIVRRRRGLGLVRGDGQRLDEPAAPGSALDLGRRTWSTSIRGRRCSTPPRRCRPPT